VSPKFVVMYAEVSVSSSRMKTRTALARRPQLDDLDRRVLAHLQDDARITSVELARRLKLSPPGLQKRVRKLEQGGVIKGYATLVSRQAVGLDLLCFVQVLLAHHRPGSVERFPARSRSHSHQHRPEGTEGHDRAAALVASALMDARS
jgi:DNA-binding Lrp family transcriptional regulator